MSNELKVAIGAAKLGAQVALKYFHDLPPVTLKPDNTPVTIADKETEQIIRGHIAKSFPSASFVGEEFGGDFTKGDVWIIDPIDGTKNFIRGLPFWSILISFVKNGMPVLGVSYAPAINELLSAEVGQGAYLNGEKIHVSTITKLKEASLNYGTLAYYEDRLPNVIKLFSTSFHARGFGDCYGYHLVAEGKSDAMMDAHNGPWDIAAFKVIIQEAGGKLTTFDGKEWTLKDSTSVATNGLVHNEVIAILNRK